MSNSKQSFALGGVRPRTVLGFLLLHNNSVVPASNLIRALWPHKVPPTGRKMLHNAISHIRGMFYNQPGSDLPMLVTHAPGYLLRVQPESVDLNRFQTQAAQGHDELLGGQWEQAVRTLSDALSLWRGPALADLTETGVSWPELVALENAKLTAIEACMEAKLALGRHAEVISVLEVCMETGPLRERISGQLMRALYQSGRQTDALAIYRRTRASLVDNFGLDPSPELQELEQSILNHDLRAETVLVPITPVDRSPKDPVVVTRPPVQVPVATPLPHMTMIHAGPATVPDAPDTAMFTALIAEIKQVSLVLVVAESAGEPEIAPERTALAHEHLGQTVASVAADHGGVVSTILGPVWLIAFGVPNTDEFAPWRAIRSAEAIQGRLAGDDSAESPAGESGVTISVFTGQALVSQEAPPAPDKPMVTGGLLNRALRETMSYPAGRVSVCPATQHATGAMDFDAEPIPRQLSASDKFAHTGPIVGRELELQALRAWWGQVRQLNKPHLATILGAAGIGKSRLVQDFCQGIQAEPSTVQQFSGSVTPWDSARHRLAAIAEIIRSCLGIRPYDSQTIAREKAAAAIAGLPGLADSADWVLRHLEALITESETAGEGDAFFAWVRFLEEVIARRPTVLVIEDLHHADEIVVDFVDHLSEHTSHLPLLLIVTARPSLLDRRPGWSGGKLHASSTVLQPLSDQEIEHLLLDIYCYPEEIPTDFLKTTCGTLRDNVNAVLAKVGGNPLFAIEFAKMMFDRTGTQDPWRWAGTREPMPLPSSIHRVLGSQIDVLPASVKAVLYDAAVLADNICDKAMAAMGSIGVDAAERSLRYLERGDLLVRTGTLSRTGRPAYRFRHDIIRDVIHARMTKFTLAQKHNSVVEFLNTWAEELEPEDGWRSGIRVLHC